MLTTLTKPITIEALEDVLKPLLEKLTTLGVEAEASERSPLRKVGGFRAYRRLRTKWVRSAARVFENLLARTAIDQIRFGNNAI